jgi:hypothetical protein
MGSYSAVFHPTERKLLWTSVFVFTDAATKTTTKLLNFEQQPYEASFITGKSFPRFEKVNWGSNH